MLYTDYQNQPSSEKITLVAMAAARRLMGWVVHSGSIYKLTGFDYPAIQHIQDSGVTYTESVSLGAVIAGRWYYDKANTTLYLQASDSSNPNSRFLVATLNLFFADAPITLPYNFPLTGGYEVMWEPMLRSTSEFGVGIDTINQTSEAIEGSGSLTLNNDFDFWPKNFDKLSFENQPVYVYSYHRDLDSYSEAQLIYKGNVEKKSYGKETITFQLKDKFAVLRDPIPLSTIGDLAARTPEDLNKAFQRMVLGRVSGHVPTNIDQVVDGYPLTGTVAVNYNTLTVTGTGTAFLAELSPDDQIVLLGEEYTVASVASNTSLTLTSEYLGNQNLSGATAYVVPDMPKRWQNRVWNVAGHPLREPTTTTTAGSSILVLYVVDATDFHDGDTIYIGPLGSGELAVIDKVIGTNYIYLATSLAAPPAAGTAIRRPAVQNVRIDDTLLVYYRDYTLDATTATLTLTDTAEANAGPIYQLGTNVTFTNTSRTVTGSGFMGVIQPGYMIGAVGQADFFEVLSVDSDTQISLRSAATYTSTAAGRYKSLILDPDNSVLTLDCLGRPEDDNSSLPLLRTAPAISRALLEDSQLLSDLDTSTFGDAEEIAYQEIGLVVPETYSSTAAPTYRDVLNQINKSVFGSLVQTGDFEIAYHVLQPRKPATATKFTESDILSYSLNATAENVVKTVVVEYSHREHDYETKKESIQTSQKTSPTSTYVAKTERTRTISTCLVNQTDAEIMANRWAFLLQSTVGRLTFTTKLQGMKLEVGDIIEIEHRKFFERFGSTGKRKLLMVESVARSGSDVKVEATDLGNTFNRVACINSFSTAWTSASEDERLYGGYITDQYGLINNDPISFETNLIW